MKFTNDKTQENKNYDNSTLETLQAELQAIQGAKNSNYTDDRASLCLPFDEEYIQTIEAKAKEYKDKIKALVVIGIGGSNLGTIAIHEALKGKDYNEQDGLKVYYADTTDARTISRIEEKIKRHQDNNEEVLLNAISKSGSTAETISNLATLQAVCKNIIITTDSGSKLEAYCQERDIPTLRIPKLVGGRYSVFSAVGLFPLSLIGIDIRKLTTGAKKAIEDTVKLAAASSTQPLQNTHVAAIDNALTTYAHMTAKDAAKKRITNMFIFGSDFESIGKWNRQLVGESLGKENDKEGKQVHAGIFPTVSMGSTDLHSVGQYFLGGPQDFYHQFVLVDEDKKEIPSSDLETLVPAIKGKSLNDIMDAITKGTMTAAANKSIPFCTYTLSVDETDIGYLLQTKMIETMIIGALLNINPFDQPNVEDYKKVTREILAQ